MQLGGIFEEVSRKAVNVGIVARLWLFRNAFSISSSRMRLRAWTHLLTVLEFRPSSAQHSVTSLPIEMT